MLLLDKAMLQQQSIAVLELNIGVTGIKGSKTD